MLPSLLSTSALSLVWRPCAPCCIAMPRDSTQRCAYIDCKKTTDKPSFGTSTS